MLTYESGIYTFSLKGIPYDVCFRVWNNDIEDYEIIKIMDDVEVSYDVLKKEVKDFIDRKVEDLQRVLKGLDNIGDE